MTKMVKSVQRALTVIDHLGRRDALGVRELGAELGMPKSTIHALLQTLEAGGYVVQDESTQRYRLSVRFFELGTRVIARLGLREQALPILEELAVTTGEAVRLGVLDGGEVVYLEHLETRHPIGVFARPGERAPVHCTSQGKALIAYLSEPERRQILLERGLKAFTEHTITSIEELEADLGEGRRHGYFCGISDYLEDVGGVAAPVRDQRAQVVAAISIVGPASRLTSHRMAELGQLVKDRAARISARLGCPPAGEGAMLRSNDERAKGGLRRSDRKDRRSRP